MNIIPLPDPGQLLLVVTPYIGGEAIFDLAARLAHHGPRAAESTSDALEVLDAGNTFNAYRAVHALRRLDAHAHTALQATRLARAFTCYQVAAALEEMAQAPRPGLPLLVLDMLSSFGDQGVAQRERRRLLTRCLSLLKDLAAHRPVGVWARKRTLAPEEMLEFHTRLEHAAAQVWRLEAPAVPNMRQERLF